VKIGHSHLYLLVAIQQEIAAQEIEQAIADEIKGQREQKAAEFNRLAAEAERMTTFKSERK